MQQSAHLGRGKRCAVCHCALKALPRASLLLAQLLHGRFQLENDRILRNCLRHGFERLAAFLDYHARSPVIVDGNAHLKFAQRLRLQQRQVLPQLFALHAPDQAHPVGETERRGKIVQRGAHGLALALAPLRAELTAFLQKLLEELISLQCLCRIVCVHRQQGIAAKPVLIALFQNLAPERLFLEAAERSVGIELTAPVGVGAVGDVFCRLVERLKALLAERVVSLQKPVAV